MLRNLLFLIVVVVGAFAAYVALKPAEYSIARSAVIPASPEAIFPHINNLKKWEAWSPWAKKDPDAKNSFSGPEEGEGAKFTWSGNSEVGAGTMTIVESQPNEKIKVKLDFTEPMVSTADVDFEFVPVAEGTKVTWSMQGKQSFVERAMCTLMGGLDSIVGGEYEKGLENLKGVVAGG